MGTELGKNLRLLYLVLRVNNAPHCLRPPIRGRNSVQNL